MHITVRVIGLFQLLNDYIDFVYWSVRSCHWTLADRWFDPRTTSVDAALAIVDALQAEGYRFVTVEELLEASGIRPEAGVLYCSGEP